MTGHTLVAMSASGETLVVRDGDGQLWLVRAEGAGVPLLLDDVRADHAVDRYGLDRVGQTFSNWKELDGFRQQRAGAITPEVIVDAGAFDHADVRELLAVGRRWAAEGQRHRAARLATALLGVPVVRADDSLFAETKKLLGQCLEPEPAYPSEPATSLQSEARQRWRTAMQDA